jgi:hypothetical protein
MKLIEENMKLKNQNIELKGKNQSYIDTLGVSLNSFIIDT